VLLYELHNKERKMNELYQYALDNYEAGGHWIVECWDAADYNDILEECNGDVAAAKLVIQ